MYYVELGKKLCIKTTNIMACREFECLTISTDVCSLVLETDNEELINVNYEFVHAAMKQDDKNIYLIGDFEVIPSYGL